MNILGILNLDNRLDKNGVAEVWARTRKVWVNTVSTVIIKIIKQIWKKQQDKSALLGDSIGSCHKKKISKRKGDGRSDFSRCIQEGWKRYTSEINKKAYEVVKVGLKP